METVSLGYTGQFFPAIGNSKLSHGSRRKMDWPEDDEYSSFFSKRYSVMMAEESSLPIIYYRSQNPVASKSMPFFIFTN